MGTTDHRIPIFLITQFGIYYNHPTDKAWINQILESQGKMNNITSPSVWETLSVPMPAEFIHHASLNRQIETLEKKNNTSTYIILGLGLLLVGVGIIVLLEQKKKTIDVIKNKFQSTNNTYIN